MPIEYEDNTAWPPAPYDMMQEEMSVWTAWWVGDTEELTDIYTNRHLFKSKTRRNRRTAPNADQRDVFFWGKANSQGTKRRHVSVPASVARASAALLFSKPPRISPGPDDEKNTELAERMEKIFGPTAYGGELHEAAELNSVHGTVYLRPWWDREVADHVVPSHVPADRAIPEFRFNRLIAVTFWNVVSEPGEHPVLRHLERHEKGKNYHALYAGDETNLGKRIDLTKHAATAWADKIVDDEGCLETGLNSIDVVPVPNILPNRTWHSIPGLAPLGRSDFDGIEGEFDALDEIHTSWMRDVEDAKSRIIVDESLFTENGPGQGGTYESEKHIYTNARAALGSAADSGGPLIQDIKFDIRYQEHAQTAAEAKQHILEHVGISAQHFADGPLAVGVMTATEVNAKDNITETTRGAKINYWLAALDKFVDIVMRLDAIHFQTGLNMTDRPSIKFSAQHSMSEADRAQTVATKRSAGLQSRWEGIREMNPDWTDDEIRDEIERIEEDEVKAAQLAFGQGLDGDEEGDAGEGEEAGEDPDAAEDVDGSMDTEELEDIAGDAEVGEGQEGEPVAA